MSDRKRDGKPRRGGRVENAFFYISKPAHTCACPDDSDFPSQGPGQPPPPQPPQPPPPPPGSPPQP